MKEFKYVPKKIFEAGDDFEEAAHQWSGSVILKVPNYKERLQLVKEMNFKVGKDGDADNEDSISGALKMLDLVEKHVVAVDLKFADQAFISLDDLGCSKEGSALINELGVVLLQGISLGNG